MYSNNVMYNHNALKINSKIKREYQKRLTPIYINQVQSIITTLTMSASFKYAADSGHKVRI